MEMLLSMEETGVSVPLTPPAPQTVDIDEDFDPTLPQGEPPASVNFSLNLTEEDFSRDGGEKKIYTADNIPYLDIARKEAREQNFDLELILAVIRKESGFNPRSISSAGALGLMQMLPDTAKWLGLKDTSRLTNPSTSIKYGVKYLRYLFREFCEIDVSQLKAGDIEHHSVKKSLAAYNAGPGNVRKYSRPPYNGIPPFKETKSYIKLVSSYFMEFETMNLSAQATAPKMIELGLWKKY